MKNWIPSELRSRIQDTIPEGLVIPRHTEAGHFYEIDHAAKSPYFLRSYADGYSLAIGNVGPASEGSRRNPVYPSVTGRLQILKDEGLMNYKMNQALQYMFAHFKEFTDANIMEHMDIASRVSQDILRDAGDIGTRVHGYREDIFKEWIRTGERPKDFLSFIPEADTDIRAVSAIRGLNKFCDERGYIPVQCELMVYSDDLKTGGALDDLGLMRKIVTDSSDPNCQHQATLVTNQKNGKQTCMLCGYQFVYEFILLDVKTSNQFKDHYFFQVALYWQMFVKLSGLRPERCYILKLSKEDGGYKLEELKRPAKLAEYARYMIRTNEGMDFIKSLRKDNQRRVVAL